MRELAFHQVWARLRRLHRPPHEDCEGHDAANNTESSIVSYLSEGTARTYPSNAVWLSYRSGDEPSASILWSDVHEIPDCRQCHGDVREWLRHKPTGNVGNVVRPVAVVATPGLPPILPQHQARPLCLTTSPCVNLQIAG